LLAANQGLHGGGAIPLNCEGRYRDRYPGCQGGRACSVRFVNGLETIPDDNLAYEISIQIIGALQNFSHDMSCQLMSSNIFEGPAESPNGSSSCRNYHHVVIFSHDLSPLSNNLALSRSGQMPRVFSLFCRFGQLKQCCQLK
jgi:hypothetical protein